MFTHKDIETRTIFVVNCIKERNLRVCNGELLLEEAEEKKTLTKLPFQKILALFVVGNITVTTPLLDKCKKNNVALVVVNASLRPVFFWSNSAEANFLLREKQFAYQKDDLSIAKVIVANKVKNQMRLMERTRLKNDLVEYGKQQCKDALLMIPEVMDYNTLLGLEGRVAKAFFSAYYHQLGWTSRKPRAKTDALNATLDIGYTILFNFMECFARMFGFDVYVGVYHRLWFKRKSLICDLMEPFRCIIDHQVRIAFNRKQCSENDFDVVKNEYRLKFEKNADYCRLFFDALIPHKTEVFMYVRDYYRCFMQGKAAECYPEFVI